jgi:hypothetical protein
VFLALGAIMRCSSAPRSFTRTGGRDQVGGYMFLKCTFRDGPARPQPFCVRST